MKEFFGDFDLELKMRDVCYDIDQASIDAHKCLTIILPVMENVTGEAELIICGTSRLFATAKIKITESRIENDKTILLCLAPPQDFHFFQRNFLRLNINTPVRYIYLKAASPDALTAVSDSSHGMLINISPCGALLLIPKSQKEFLKENPDSTTHLKLSFTFTDELGKATSLEIISKIVNCKKTWNIHYIGVLFQGISAEQYCILENLYKERTTNLKAINQDKADYFFSNSITSYKQVIHP